MHFSLGGRRVLTSHVRHTRTSFSNRLQVVVSKKNIARNENKIPFCIYDDFIFEKFPNLYKTVVKKKSTF